jgi:adenylate cyclase
VRKHRTLVRVGRTRIHFDQVEGLGRFIELEVVMAADEPEENGREEARELMRRLRIAEGDLIEGSYIDMLGDTG